MSLIEKWKEKGLWKQTPESLFSVKDIDNTEWEKLLQEKTIIAMDKSGITVRISILDNKLPSKIKYYDIVIEPV